MGIFRKAQKMLSEGEEMEELGAMLVEGLFEGTEVTRQVLDNLEIAEQVFLEDSALEMFLDELDKVNKLKKKKPIIKVNVE